MNRGVRDKRSDRAFEQVRNSIGYPHLNVKIGATHAGISVGEDGASHQCLEDLALMRTIPGMVVMCPADDTEARKAMRAAVEHDGPVCIRFGRAPVPVVFDEDYKFETGKVVTAEEHNIIGGLGGAVAECLAEKCPTKMYRIGMRDKPVSASRAHTKMHLPAGGQSSRSILLDCCVFSRCPYAIMNGL